MKPLKKKKLNKPILVTKLLDNKSLVVVDSNTDVRFLDKDNLDLISGFKTNINHSRYKTDVVSFSKDGKFLATITSDVKESKLFNVSTKKMIAKVTKHKGDVSCVAIDNKCRYMFSCGDDGKVYAVDIKQAKITFSYPAHADTINDIAFSKNSQWIATASYDKSITLYNLSMMNIKHKMRAHTAPVMKLHFLSKHRLFSVDRHSKAIIWDIYTGSVIARLSGIHDDITKIIHSGDDKFLFLGTALGYILVYSLENYELLSKSYIKLNTSITSLGFDNEKNILIIGSDNGEVLYYPLYKEEAYLKELVQKHKFSEAEEYAASNVLLKYTASYKLMEEIWIKTLNKGKIYLQKDDKVSAEKIFHSFKDIPSKNKIIKKVMKDYIEFNKFYTLAKNGKIALAYSLVNAHPIYKESLVYKSLESRWKKSFALANKCSINPAEQEKAREILAPYRGVSEKTKYIQEIFVKGAVHNRFTIAIDRKDFKHIDELIKLHPFLKEFPEYDVLMEYTDNLYVKSQKLIEKNNLNSAIKILKILINFSDFKAEAHELLIEITNKHNFFTAIKNDDMVEAYNLLDTKLELQDTTEGKKLQQEWNDDLDLANSLAVNVNIDDIQVLLKKYMQINSKIATIATVFSRAYIAQMEDAIKSKTDQTVLEHGIKNHLLNFGLQNQLVNFFDIFKKYYPSTKLDIELLTKGVIEKWRPSMIFNSILD